MPILTIERMRLPVCPVHVPLRTRSAKAAMRSSTPCTSATTLRPSTMIEAEPRGAQRDVQDGAVLGGVDAVAAKHRLNALRDPGRSREREQSRERLVRYAMLRVIDVQARRLGHIALAARGVGSEQRPQMDRAHLVRVRLQRVPLRKCGERGGRSDRGWRRKRHGSLPGK